MKTRLSLICAGSAVVTALLASPPAAEARYKRVHASGCIEQSPSHKYLVQTGTLWNDDNSSLSALICALPEDRDFPKTAVTQLTVTGFDGNSSNAVFIHACIAYGGSTGAACDQYVATGPGGTFTGPFTLSVPRSTWTNGLSTDFAYIETFLPPVSPGRSGMRGLFAADVNG